MRRHLTYANVAATLALVFAMSGGALAAKHYLITSTGQIKPSVLKALRGREGPAGPSGPPGQGVPGYSELQELKQKVGHLEAQMSEVTEAADALCDGLYFAESDAKIMTIGEASRWEPIAKSLQTMKSYEGGTGFCASFEV